MADSNNDYTNSDNSEPVKLQIIHLGLDGNITDALTIEKPSFISKANWELSSFDMKYINDKYVGAFGGASNLYFTQIDLTGKLAVTDSLEFLETISSLSISEHNEYLIGLNESTVGGYDRLISVSQNGTIVWETPFLFEGLEGFIAKQIKFDKNSIFVMGLTWIEDPFFKFFGTILKFSGNGNLIWGSIVSEGGETVRLECFTILEDESVVAAGYRQGTSSQTPMCVYKLDSNGNLAWNNVFYPYPSDLRRNWINGIHSNNDGSLSFSGTSRNNIHTDISHLVFGKLNEFGRLKE